MPQLKIRNICRFPGLCPDRLISGIIRQMIWWPGDRKVFWRMDCWTRSENGSTRPKEGRRPSTAFVDLSRITSVAVRSSHVFDFARRRTEQFGGSRPVKSVVFSDDWVGFGIARMYESLMEGARIEVRAFRDRAKAAEWLQVPAEVLNLEDNPAPSG